VPSVLSHPAVPLALSAAAGSRLVPGGVVLAAFAASVLPDADSFGYWAGVPYDSPFGHRGFTHSLVFAGLVALAAAAFARRLRAPAATVFAVVFVAGASHGILDAMTTGGRGVAFFSPFSNARYFLPWRPIEVSPIGIRGFFMMRGAQVFASELAWIWLPAALVAFAGFLVRRGRPAEG
jgi:inner membrane protein